ncbi:MAG: hypothetical protein JWM19_966 [Actinomycetia bacterium]|nr:hypothetical protein [Actinomycetes bacterium]
MQGLDELIRPLYENGVGCRTIAAQLGEHPASVYKRVHAMGLLRSKDQVRRVAPDLLVPFRAESSEKNLRVASIGEAASWFLRRGYVVSVPLAVAQYDLVVESDDGFMKIQVKSTTARDRYGRWTAGVARMEYAASSEANANGSRQRRPYRDHEIDFFFIVTGGGDRYLIPLEATDGAAGLTLNDKYAAYKVA